MMWLARNKDGTLSLFNDKPTINHSKTSWTVKNCDYGYPIWNEEMKARFSDVAWENSPVAVDITLSMDNFLNKKEAIMKSFCNGCKHWEYIQACENNGHGFHFCNLFDRYELKWRKLWCNGKLKEE